jgi:hypothetical protein
MIWVNAFLIRLSKRQEMTKREIGLWDPSGSSGSIFNDVFIDLWSPHWNNGLALGELSLYGSQKKLE